MKIEYPYFLFQPEPGSKPFIQQGGVSADSVIRVKIDGNICDVYLSTKDDWEIFGVLNLSGVDIDTEQLRKKLIAHPNLRLFYLT
jgi:hypothetical protein